MCPNKQGFIVCSPRMGEAQQYCHRLKLPRTMTLTLTLTLILILTQTLTLTRLLNLPLTNNPIGKRYGLCPSGDTHSSSRLVEMIAGGLLSVCVPVRPCQPFDTYTHTHTYTHPSAYTRKHSHAHIQLVHTYKVTDLHTHTHTHTQRDR